MNPDNNINNLEGVDVEELQRRIWHDTMLLNLVLEQNKSQNHVPNHTKQQPRQNMSHPNDFIMQHMNKVMEVCRPKGFVYGMISEDGTPVSGASENLHGWWKDRVRFEEKAPEAISDYNVKRLFGGIMDKSRMSTPHILQKLHDTSLGCLLSTLIQHCDPPQRQYPLEKGVAPPWWPTGDEEWLGDLGVDKEEFPLSYRKPHYLKKAMKICVLMAVFRNMSPNMDKIHSIVMHSKRLQEKMSPKEAAIIVDAIKHEEARLYRENSSFVAAKRKQLYEDEQQKKKQAGTRTDNHQMNDFNYHPLNHTAPFVDQVAMSSCDGVSQFAVAESGLEVISDNHLHQNTRGVNIESIDISSPCTSAVDELVDFFYNLDDDTL